jgi:DNA-binding transcriptional ArsR family regulator
VPTTAPDLDDVFAALADPTRRAVISRLGQGPASTKELAADHAMALPSFMAHLDLLGRVGLVTSEKQGRVRTYRLEPAGLEPAEHWLEAQHRLWSSRLDQLDAFLASTHGQQPPSATSQHPPQDPQPRKRRTSR